MTAPPGEAPDEIRIWRLDLDALADRWCDRFDALSPAERRRASAFRVPIDARRWSVCRTALRSILSPRIGCVPADVPIQTAPSGKPRLHGPGSCGVGFNVSHSGPHALIAVSDGCEVGIDLEATARFPENPDPGDPESWSCAFAAAERAWLAGLPTHSDRRRGAMRLWTAREATLKWSGTGFLAPIESAAVDLEAGCARVGIPPEQSGRPTGGEIHRVLLLELDLSVIDCIGFLAIAQEVRAVVHPPEEWWPAE